MSKMDLGNTVEVFTTSNPPQKPQTCPVYGPEHQYTVVVEWEYSDNKYIGGTTGSLWTKRKATKVMCACTAVKEIV